MAQVDLELFIWPWTSDLPALPAKLWDYRLVLPLSLMLCWSLNPGLHPQQASTTPHLYHMSHISSFKIQFLDLLSLFPPPLERYYPQAWVEEEITANEANELLVIFFRAQLCQQGSDWIRDLEWKGSHALIIRVNQGIEERTVQGDTQCSLVPCLASLQNKTRNWSQSTWAFRMWAMIGDRGWPSKKPV